MGKVQKMSLADKFNKEYFELLFPASIIEIGLLVWTICDFSILHLGWLLMQTAFLVCVIFWMQPRFFQDRSTLNKEIKAWNRRKREAMNAGIPFNEPKPARTKILTPPTLALFFACMSVILYGTIFLALFNIAIPKGNRGYEKDIRKLKEERQEKYFFFPDTIPEDAKDLKWIKQPGIMQGSGYEVLYFRTDNHYIREELEKYCKDVEPIPASETQVINFFTETERETALFYGIYDNGDFNHSHYWGIFHDPGTNLIVYFAM